MRSLGWGSALVLSLLAVTTVAGTACHGSDGAATGPAAAPPAQTANNSGNANTSANTTESAAVVQMSKDKTIRSQTGPVAQGTAGGVAPGVAVKPPGNRSPTAVVDIAPSSAPTSTLGAAGVVDATTQPLLTREAGDAFSICVPDMNSSTIDVTTLDDKTSAARLFGVVCSAGGKAEVTLWAQPAGGAPNLLAARSEPMTDAITAVSFASAADPGGVPLTCLEYTSGVGSATPHAGNWLCGKTIAGTTGASP
jgi:hypothetical protein